MRKINDRKIYLIMGRYPELASKLNKSLSSMKCNSVFMAQLCISQFQGPTSPRATLHSTAAPGPAFILDDLPWGPGFCISIKLRLVQ